MTMRRSLGALLAGSALLGAGCGITPSFMGSHPSVAATSAKDEAFDRDTYEALTARELQKAVETKDQATIARFVAFADGPDPDPAASRAIAQAATTRASTPDLDRIAAGHAHPEPTTKAGPIVLPRDEGAHMNAITEWWYLNGHLASARKQYGYEFTLFRVGPLLQWAHVALTDETASGFSYRREFYFPSQGHSETKRLDTRFGAQRIQATADGYHLDAKIGDDELSLDLAPQKPPLLINGDGVIDMPEFGYSWYYSVPRLAATGTLNGAEAVTGVSWLDHQWGPFYVSGFFDRWDWFSLQFEDGTDYNLFAFRDRNGKPETRYVNISGPTGRATSSKGFGLQRGGWWQSPLSALFYDTTWTLDLPQTGESVTLEAAVTDQELARRGSFLQDPLPVYWEGSMKAAKTKASVTTRGVAYCEHFGFKTRP